MNELIMNRPDRRPDKAKPEYVVYSFLKNGGRRGSDPWRRMGALNDISQARQLARSLFHTSRYSRIELRKKCVSEKTGIAVDIPLEILDHSLSREIRMIGIALGLALGCAFLALWVSLTI